MIQSVFLIEDDDDDVRLFKEALKTISSHTHLESASNGMDALKYLKTAIIKPDIIFSDMNMPIMNGIEFLKAIKAMEDFHQIPVVMLTTSTSPVHKQLVSELGARQLVVKPTDFNTLCACIKSFIE